MFVALATDQRTNITAIPEHVLAVIVRKVPRSIHGMGSVSLAWRRVVKDQQHRFRTCCATMAAESLQSFKCVDALRIVGSCLGCPCTSHIGLARLSTLTDLREVNLQFCRQLYDLSALPALAHLRTLRVLFTGIRTSTFAAMTQLTTLVLNTNAIKRDMARLAPQLERMTGLTELTIRNNSIDPKGAGLLAKSLLCLTRLQSLDLSVNNIGSNGARRLAPAIATLGTLKSLDVSHNYIRDDGMSHFAPALAALSELKALNLDSNTIGPAGAASLAPNLVPGLTSLRLTHNQIQTAGASALAPYIGAMTGLTTLDLSWNDL